MVTKTKTKKHSRGFVLANVVLWGVAAVTVGWVLVQNNPGLLPQASLTAGPAADAGVRTTARNGQPLLAEPGLGPDGMFAEDFYRPSIGNLALDLAAARAQGKILAVFWERPGCEFCIRLHNEMLREPELREYIANKFYTVRYDFYGEKAVLHDFDGTMLNGIDLARRHRVVGTPTMEFRIDNAKEVMRIPGLVEADILGAAFEFVESGAWRDGTTINQWLLAKGIIGQGRSGGDAER